MQSTCKIQWYCRKNDMSPIKKINRLYSNFKLKTFLRNAESLELYQSQSNF